MKSNIKLYRNNSNINNNIDEELLLKGNINNRKYNNKRKLPKLNISNLSNSIENYSSAVGNNKNKKKKIILVDINHIKNIDYSKEVKKAKEIKDLEKIYDKWLHREKSDIRKIEVFYEDKLSSNQEKIKDKNKNKGIQNNIQNYNNNILFLKSKKRNLNNINSKLNNTMDDKGTNIIHKFINTKINQNKIRLKTIKKNKEEKTKKEFEAKPDNDQNKKVKMKTEKIKIIGLEETNKIEKEKRIKNENEKNKIIGLEEINKKEEEKKLKNETEEKKKKGIKELVKKEDENEKMKNGIEEIKNKELEKISKI